MNGNVMLFRRKDSAMITNTYDALNRVTAKMLPAVGSVPMDSVTYSYDLKGNLASVSDMDSQVMFSFDQLARVTQTMQTTMGRHGDRSFICHLPPLPHSPQLEPSLERHSKDSGRSIQLASKLQMKPSSVQLRRRFEPRGRLHARHSCLP